MERRALGKAHHRKIDIIDISDAIYVVKFKDTLERLFRKKCNLPEQREKKLFYIQSTICEQSYFSTSIK